MVDTQNLVDQLDYINDDRSKELDRFFFPSAFLGDEETQEDADIADFKTFFGVEELPQRIPSHQDFANMNAHQCKAGRSDLVNDLKQLSTVSPPSSHGHILSSAHDSVSRTLEELLNELTLPSMATAETNDICSAILRHPDLSKKPSGINVYSKMNGGLKNYVPGTAQAWLYVPRKRARTDDDNDHLNVLNRLALIFVYPDELGPSSRCEDPKNKLHFGGRAHEINNGSVLLQHGAYKFLGLKARKFQLIEKEPSPGPAPNNQCNKDPRQTLKRSFEEGPASSSDVHKFLAPLSAPRSDSKTSEAFNADVEDVRKKLRYSDLRSINAILTEVWAREVVAAGVSSPLVTALSGYTPL